MGADSGRCVLTWIFNAAVCWVQAPVLSMGSIPRRPLLPSGSLFWQSGREAGRRDQDLTKTRSRSSALFSLFLGRVPLPKYTTQKVGTLILTSLLEDLEEYAQGRKLTMHFSPALRRWRRHLDSFTSHLAASLVPFPGDRQPRK